MRFSFTEIAENLALSGNVSTPQSHKNSTSNIHLTKDISDIFLPIISSDGSSVDLHILIEGALGIGKTILTKEIAYQWAKSKLLNSKELVFLVFLRECYLTQLMSIKGLLEYFFEDDQMTTYLLKYLLDTDGEDTVIIFDGYDELSKESRKKCVKNDIICRKKLTKSCLVITSRPTASSGLHGLVDRCEANMPE